MLLSEDCLNHVEKCDAEDGMTFILSIQEPQATPPPILSPSQTQSRWNIFCGMGHSTTSSSGQTLEKNDENDDTKLVSFFFEKK